MKTAPWVLLIICFVRPALAEVITFKNGDKLTGVWLRVANDKLIFKSEVAGEISLALNSIQSFSTENAVVVVLRKGGTVEAEKAVLGAGVWQADTKSGVQTLDPRETAAIYPREIYLPRSPERASLPWRNWHGTGELGYSLLRGDRQSRSLSIGVNSTRRQPDLPGLSERFRTNYSLKLLLADARTVGEPHTSANSVSTGIRQDFLFSRNNFLFVMGQLEHI
jgi:hypothetical protein